MRNTAGSICGEDFTHPSGEFDITSGFWWARVAPFLFFDFMFVLDLVICIFVLFFCCCCSFVSLVSLYLTNKFECHFDVIRFTLFYQEQTRPRKTNVYKWKDRLKFKNVKIDEKKLKNVNITGAQLCINNFYKTFM